MIGVLFVARHCDLQYQGGTLMSCVPTMRCCDCKEHDVTINRENDDAIIKKVDTEV